MLAMTNGLTNWFRQVVRIVTSEFSQMGPEGYSYVLIAVAITGWLLLSKSIRRP